MDSGCAVGNLRSTASRWRKSSDVSSDGRIEERSTYSLPMDNHSPESWIYESDWTDDGYGTDDGPVRDKLIDLI